MTPGEKLSYSCIDLRGITNDLSSDFSNFSSISFLNSTSSFSIFSFMYLGFLRGPQARAMMLPVEVRCSPWAILSLLVTRCEMLSRLYDLVNRWCLVWFCCYSLFFIFGLGRLLALLLEPEGLLESASCFLALPLYWDCWMCFGDWLPPPIWSLIVSGSFLRLLACLIAGGGVACLSCSSFL